MGRSFGVGFFFFLHLRREGCWTADAPGMAKVLPSEADMNVPEGCSVGEAVTGVSGGMISPVWWTESSPTNTFLFSIFVFFFGPSVICPSS